MSFSRIIATASAKAYLKQRDTEDRILELAQQSSARDEKARAWLADYRAGRLDVRPFTKFKWEPRYPFNANIIGLDNGKTIEGEFTVMAHADAAGKGAGEDVSELAGSEAAARAGGEAAQESARAEIGYDTPF